MISSTTISSTTFAFVSSTQTISSTTTFATISSTTFVSLTQTISLTLTLTFETISFVTISFETISFELFANEDITKLANRSSSSPANSSTFFDFFGRPFGLISFAGFSGFICFGRPLFFIVFSSKLIGSNVTPIFSHSLLTCSSLNFNFFMIFGYAIGLLPDGSLNSSLFKYAR